MLPRPLILQLLSLHTALTAGIALKDIQFGTPVDTGTLSPKCLQAFNSDIVGCTLADFASVVGGAQCSQACSAALVKEQKDVQNACSNDDVSDSSILGLFILGQALKFLCPGEKVSTTSATTTKAAQPTIAPGTTRAPPATTTSSLIVDTSSSPLPSSAEISSTTATSKPSLITSTFATSTVPASTTTPINSPTGVQSSLIIDSATPSSQGQSSSTATATTSMSAVQEAQGNLDTGGGSPFDVAATASDQRVGYILGLTFLTFGWLLIV